MKDKETTSIKSLSQSTRPYPSTPCPALQTTHSGPKYSPPNTLPDNDDMDQIPNFLPPPPSPTTSRSPPDTPTQPMSAPVSPTAPHATTPEEESILAHLALAEKNRSVLRQDGPNH
ncbi:hypothetical protein DEU56DRAFT_914074 [Suillus clintonianus]|uniref:uncharacterized protein n=1 Tax=Suillus clintonianus TaxID=1904413 RepID=UPI001B87B203|nr:uncharacterized protein DEU56DRAFT_914074 [Suillus clintonianus]KAG2132748.1 hypothetical protein DEU56DRAFT_914074 [Suillus clintonianus]